MTTKMKRNQKNQFFTWLSLPTGQLSPYQLSTTHPCILVTMLAPNPWVQLTLIPPTNEQIEMYGIIFFFPYFGATKKTMMRLAAMRRLPQTRKPTERKRCLNALIVVTDCSWGALRARMVAPMMQRMQPIQPCASVSPGIA